MHRVTLRRVLRALSAAALLAAAVIFVTSQQAVAGSGGGGGGQCTVYVGGQWVTVQCGSGSGGAPGGGSGGGSTKITMSCTFQLLDEAQAKNLGLQWPPPKGQSWALMDCIGGKTGQGPQAVLINNATGAPEVTPEQLFAEEIKEIPTLAPSTAPPRGKDGLVGLPEWFWVPGKEWRTLTLTASAGPVWATAVATPVSLSITPGGGIGSFSCAGPGTAYNPGKPASTQHSDCWHIYGQPSVGQPGNAYQASLAVAWRVTWTGSGGVGGVIDPWLPVAFQFTVPVAQGEALVTSP
jgi:hypothetical protein